MAVAHTLHGTDLAWLELMLTGGFPRRYPSPDEAATSSQPLATGPPLVVTADVAEAALAAGRLDLLDPEGVTVARVVVDRAAAAPDVTGAVAGAGAAASAWWVSGTPETATPYHHVDHVELRALPGDVAASWPSGRVTALWGELPMTWAVREAARLVARRHDSPLIQIHPVAPGKETDRRTHLLVRAARHETTRGPDDRLLVIPDPGLGWSGADILARATIVAEHGATDLLLPPGRLAALKDARREVEAASQRLGVTLDEVPAHPGEAALSTSRLDELLVAGSALPSWFAEEPVSSVWRAFYRPRREAGFTVLLSGLSGSGKSTVARSLAVRLAERDSRSVSLLDGDVVRHHLSKGLGFSRTDRDTNVRRIGFVASEITKAGGIAVCCPIAPYDATRKDVRTMVSEHGAFVLVHVATPLAECERRDRKGLYAKARRGEIPEFTGISDPYDEPTDAEVTIDTTGRPVDECVDAVLAGLERLGLLASPQD